MQTNCFEAKGGYIAWNGSHLLKQVEWPSYHIFTRHVDIHHKVCHHIIMGFLNFYSNMVILFIDKLTKFVYTNVS